MTDSSPSIPPSKPREPGQEDEAAPPNSRRALLREVFLAWAATFLLCLVAGLLGRVVPFVGANVLALVALIFFGVPWFVLRRRGYDPARFGIEEAGNNGVTRRPLAVALLTALIVFPPFIGAYHVFHGVLLERAPDFEVRRLMRWDPPLDGHPGGLAESDAVHVWASGDRVSLYAGAEWSGSPQELVLRANGRVTYGGGELQGGRVERGGARCLIAPGRGCYYDGPSWSALDLRGALDESVQLGRWRDRRELPIKAERGYWWWLMFVVVQIGMVALPEEFLYRGYVQTRLDQALGKRWRLWGADIGPGLIIASALFALGHLAIEPGVYRLAVFFPSLLFGWLRARTGGIAASVAIHAASNVVIKVVASFYYY